MRIDTEFGLKNPATGKWVTMRDFQFCDVEELPETYSTKELLYEAISQNTTVEMPSPFFEIVELTSIIPTEDD